MKAYTFGVLFLLYLFIVILPENNEAYSAGTGRFGDESKLKRMFHGHSRFGNLGNGNTGHRGNHFKDQYEQYMNEN